MGALHVKFVLFKNYKREGHPKVGFYYRGEGEQIEVDAENYLAENFYPEVLFHPFVRKTENENVVEFDDRFFIDYLIEKERSKEITGSTVPACAVSFYKYLGPLGKNDFFREGDKYICKGFRIDEEWFRKEYFKLERLRNAFHVYHGFVTDIYEVPQRYRDLQSRKASGLTRAEEKILNECSEDQIDIAEKYFSGHDITLAEKSFFERMNKKTQEVLKHFHVGNPLSEEEEKELRSLEKKIKDGEDILFKKVNVNAKKDAANRDRFLYALNDVMHNVREIRSWDKGHKCFVTEQIPVNCFGYFALFALQSLKTNKGYYNCEECGRAEFFNHKSIKMCDPCKAAKRKRKSYIKKDVLEGLSLEQVLAKRKRKAESIEMYNELKAELNL